MVILLQDASILAVNKPAGLRTIPDGYDVSLPHLMGLLQETYGKIWVVHRLDKDTSGAILFALTAEAHRNLSIQFQQREAKKEYHAMVLGVPGWRRKQVGLPLLVNGDRDHRTVVNERKGKPAVTDFEHLNSSYGISYLAAHPHSGYTHQIRVHLAAIGLPMLHDPLYKSRQPETEAHIEARQILPSLPIRRTALHAFRLVFRHPITGEITTVEAPEPEDFRHTLDFLNIS